DSSPTATLRRTTQADWFREVTAALTGNKGKASPEYQEMIKHVFPEIGSAEDPLLRYNSDTYELTWRCRKRAFAGADPVARNAAIDFLKYAGSNRFNRNLYQPEDIKPGSGKLKFNIVFADTVQRRPPSATLKKTKRSDWRRGTRA